MYQPFPRKSLQQPLTEEDFQGLVDREVVEGIYVEYKSEMPSSKKVARAIAGFANTHGGWLIIGITENGGGKPSACLGIEIDGVDVEGIIRNICRDLIAPMPPYSVRVVTKSDGRILLAISVQESSQAPHICNDGTVPIRVASSTQSIGPTNHYELGRLVSRGEIFRSKYRDFAIDVRRDSEDRPKASISMYIWPVDPIDHEFDMTAISSSDGLKRARVCFDQSIPIAIYENIKEMMSATGVVPMPSSGTSHVPIDAVYAHGGALYFEQGRRGGLFGELDTAGRYRLHFPLPLYDVSNVSKNKVSDDVGGILRQAFESGYRAAFDAGIAWYVLTHFLSLYLALLNGRISPGGYRISYEMYSVDRLVPFVNHEGWVEHVGQYGYARFHSSHVSFPSGRQEPFFLCGDAASLRALSVSVAPMIFGIPLPILIQGWDALMDDES